MPHTFVILASACIAIGVIFWLSVSLRSIVRYKAEVNRADKQLAMYKLLQVKARDDPELARTQKQVELSRVIYRNVVAQYNQCLTKPLNLLPAMILGYHTMKIVKDSTI